MEAMYSTLKALVADSEWSKYVDTLISEAESIRDGSIRLLHIFTEEQMWDKYMAYIRNNPSTYLIDDTPQELKELYKEEIARLYALAVRDFFLTAANRDSYRNGVALLRRLIEYGGKTYADQIVIEQKSRTPRRPALIDELSKL